MEKSRGKKRRQVQEIKSDSDDFQPSKKERRKSSNMIEGGVEDKSSNIMNGQEKKDPMKLIVEKAKSGRAECKKCGEKIAFQDIRIGIVTEGDWGLFTRWQHLGCTVFDCRTTVEEISGFDDLDAAAQSAIRNRIAETKNDIDDDLVPVEPNELVRKDWNIPVEPHSDLLMPLLPYQKEGLGWMLHQEQTAAHGGILADEMGMGKAQPLDSLILCPSGWRMIKDLKCGDLVIGSHGKSIKVTGTFPQGIRETYWVEFSDGVGVEVSDYHLWSIFEKGNDKVPSVVTTLELFNRSKSASWTSEDDMYLGQIPIVSPVEFDPHHSSVDPYTLGSFLMSIDCLTSEYLSITFHQRDLEHYLKHLQLSGEWHMSIENESVKLVVSNEFRISLLGCLTSDNDRLMIPQDIKLASIPHRRAFLHGLLDMSPCSNCTLPPLSKFFVPDIIEIVQSLGGLAVPQFVDEEQKTVLALYFDDFFTPYLCPSKIINYDPKSLTSPKRYILRVTPLRKTEVLCISVDAKNHLYVTENFIVTHNTIQSIALLLSNRPRDDPELLLDWDRSDAQHNYNLTKKYRGKTLIILPTVALRQWQAEITRFTKPGSLTMYCYHGNMRSSEDILQTLCYVDVVLTSYKILEIEYRRATAGSKIECSVCGKKFYPEKLRIHRKYFCGETAQRTFAQSKTERKTSKTAITDDGSDSESEEDEIDRQKKAIKKKLSEESKGDKKSSGKKSKVAKPNKKPKDDDTSSESEEEDEIDRQKKAIKKKLSEDSKGDKKNSAKKSKVDKPNKKSKDDDTKSKSQTNKKSDSSKNVKKGKKGKDESSENDEEEVDKIKSKRSVDKKNTKKRKSKNLSSDSEISTHSESEDEWYDEEVEKQILMASKADQRKMVPSLLHLISWFRVICDEAHMIKDRSTSTAKAVFNLVSLYKWCLTGTPLQNRVGELYSLVRFLRIDPFAYYFCKAKGCKCKSLHYRFTKGLCDDCEHSAMQHFCHFNKHVLNPIKRAGYVGEGRRAMLKLKQEVLDEILLRRTKTTRSEDIQLPPRIVNIRMESLDEQEDDFYQALYTQSQAQFNTYVTAGTVLHNYAHIFDILIRLRQVVDHPYLVLHGNQTNSSSQVETDVDLICGICHESPIDPRHSRCNHVFCLACITDFLQVEDADTTALCPICQTSLSISLEENCETPGRIVMKPTNLSRKNFLRHINIQKFQSSTKLEALMQELYQMKLDDFGAKGIVFSQFVNFLDILEYRIQKEGMSCAKLVGSMTVDARDKMIKAFNENPEISVLLVSLKAGGVALNLTAANYIFVMDPWWNPAAEMQAIDRTHRIGQHKPIHATRFIIQDTIEERILQLEEKKKLVFDGTIGGDASSMAKLTVDDLRFLFQ